MPVTYVLTSAALAPNKQPIVRSDGACIPPDLSNRDFAEYLTWLAEGNTPAPYVATAAPIPQEVSRRQFFQAAAMMAIVTEAEAKTLVAGVAIPASVEAAIASLPGDQRFPAEMLILGAATFVRSHALLAAFATAMGKTSADLDALFTLAATL